MQNYLNIMGLSFCLFDTLIVQTFMCLDATDNVSNILDRLSLEIFP